MPKNRFFAPCRHVKREKALGFTEWESTVCAGNILNPIFIGGPKGKSKKGVINCATSLKTRIQ